MRGVITTRDLWAKAPIIIAEFGLVAYLRCVAATVLSRGDVTFLQCVMRFERR